MNLAHVKRLLLTPACLTLAAWLALAGTVPGPAARAAMRGSTATGGVPAPTMTSSAQGGSTSTMMPPATGTGTGGSAGMHRGSTGSGGGSTGSGGDSTGTGGGSAGWGSTSTGGGSGAGGDGGDSSVPVTGEAQAAVVPAFGATNPPPVENLHQGILVDRSSGAVFSGDPAGGLPPAGMTYLRDPASSVGIEVPGRAPAPGYVIQIYHWQSAPPGSPFPGRWITLATTLRGGRAVAVNEGDYSGWFAAWWVVEPRFTDLDGNWAADAIQRLSGLGLVEGYPAPGGGQFFAPERPATREEFVTMVGRVLGLVPPSAGSIAKVPSPEQADGILRDHFADQAGIAGWARPLVAAMTRAGYVRGMEGNFNPDQPVTRIQAGAIVSRALEVAGKTAPAPAGRFRDLSAVPAWAEGAVAGGVLRGNDGLLRPNDPLTRAEASTILLRLVRDLGF